MNDTTYDTMNANTNDIHTNETVVPMQSATPGRQEV